MSKYFPIEDDIQRSFFLSISSSLLLFNHRYDEVCMYNFNNPGYASGTGHFTQLVWKGSDKLGMGHATSGQCTYVVGRYKPAGNMKGDFENNVMKGSFSKEEYCNKGGGGGGNGEGGGGLGPGGGGGGWGGGGGDWRR